MGRDSLKINAIVLAGGESRRMGTPKMLLPFGEVTMIEKVIGNIKSSGLKDITVVLGAVRDELISILRGLEVSWCINENYREGMLSSVICGLKNTACDAAAMIFPGDQPLIKPATISEIIDKFGSWRGGITVAAYKGRRGHPLVFHPRYRAEIKRLEPSGGLRQLLTIFHEHVLQAEVDDPGILKDFDTFDDYLREIKPT